MSTNFNLDFELKQNTERSESEGAIERLTATDARKSVFSKAILTVF